MISVEGLSVEFNATPLFEDVSYVVNKKDRIALVGKNGAGKSTLIKVLTGVHEFESGTIHMAGNSNAIINHSPQEAQAMVSVQYIRK